MPLDPLVKNKGPLLVSKIRGATDTFPEEFTAKFGKDIYAQNVPIDVQPNDLAGLLLESRVIQERTNERKRIDTYLGGGGPNGENGITVDDITGTTLITHVLLPDGQIGTRTRSLQPEGFVFSADSLTDSADQKNLGNGWLDQVVVTKPLVFQKTQSGKEIQDIVPMEFRPMVPTYTFSQVGAGTVTVPQILAAGELSRQEEQLDQFTFRRAITYRSVVSLPVSVPGNKKTNEYKQAVSITRILEADSTVPASPTALRDVTFTKIGNNLAVEEWADITAVFPRTRYSTEVPDVMPAEFRALIPAVVTEQTAVGNASPPSISGTTISASDEDLTLYTHRTSTTTRDLPTSGATLTGHETSSEFGGGILDVVRKVNTSDITPSSGLLIVSSTTRPLGNGWFYNETRQLPSGSWPTLTSKIYDEEIQGYRVEDEQIVDPTYAPLTGSNYVENLKTLDRWKAKRLRITRTPTAIDPGSAIVTYEYRAFQFPGTLDYNRLITYDHREGYRRASAQLAKHTIRTWWVSSGGPPSIAVDEIIMDTVNVPVYDSNNSTLAQTYPNVLHDAFSNSLGAYYPATTPSFSTYYAGTVSGTHTENVATLNAPGSGYAVGNTLTISDGAGHTVQVKVLSIGVGNSIASYDQITGGNFAVGNWGPYTASGGSGTGAQFYVWGYTANDYTAGTKWVGTERIIAASVKKTNIPNLWKCQTVGVVMR